MFRFSLVSPRVLAAAAAVLSILTGAACGQEGIVATTSSSGSGAGSSSSGTGGAGGSGPFGKPITIVDWNTHNFWDTQGTLGLDAQTAADYQKKRQAVGATLKDLNPDIAVLAEIETKAVLDDLNKSELGGTYATSLIDTKDDREIGILSRIPIDMVVSHAADTFTLHNMAGPVFTYTRDCVEVHVTFNTKKLILLGVHFRSKVAPDNPDKRWAEAEHTRGIADGLHTKDPTAGIVVLGDFNDLPGSPPFLAVQGMAPDLYTDAVADVPPPNNYSFIYQGTKELIDHQMGNPIMAAGLDKASVLIKHGPGIDDASPYASDHAPIRAVYRFE